MASILRKVPKLCMSRCAQPNCRRRRRILVGRHQAVTGQCASIEGFPQVIRGPDRQWIGNVVYGWFRMFRLRKDAVRYSVSMRTNGTRVVLHLGRLQRWALTLPRRVSDEESMQSKTEDEHIGAGAVKFSVQYDLASVPYPGDSVRPCCASGDRQGLSLDGSSIKRLPQHQISTRTLVEKLPLSTTPCDNHDSLFRSFVDKGQ